jgi:hypothetical protein
MRLNKPWDFLPAGHDALEKTAGEVPMISSQMLAEFIRRILPLAQRAEQ